MEVTRVVLTSNISYFQYTTSHSLAFLFIMYLRHLLATNSNSNSEEYNHDGRSGDERQMSGHWYVTSLKFIFRIVSIVSFSYEIFKRVCHQR